MYWLWNKFTIMNHKGGGDLPKWDTFHFIASDVLRYDYNIKWVYLAHLKIITSCMIQAKTWKTLTVRLDWHQMTSFRLAHLDGSIRISTGWAHKVFLYETTEVLGTARADLGWGVFFLTKNFLSRTLVSLNADPSTPMDDTIMFDITTDQTIIKQYP